MKKFTITNVNAVENREAWLALRRQHITATDWSKITGTNPYGTADEVIFDKQNPGIEGTYAPNLPMQVGTDMEPLIIAKAKKILGPGEYLSQTFLSRRHLGFTPDLLRINKTRDWELAEIKVSVKEWGGSVPSYYMDQVKFQATVLGIDHVQVVHLKLRSWPEGQKLIASGSVPSDRLALYRVDVSEAERKRIERQAERWWKVNIVGDDPL